MPTNLVPTNLVPHAAAPAQGCTRPGGFANDEAAKLIPGPQFSYEQGKREDDISGLRRRGGSDPTEENGENRRTVLVVFIGGVTFAEISALRFMSSQGGLNCNFIVMTTKLINGNSLLKSLCTQFN